MCSNFDWTFGISPPDIPKPPPPPPPAPEQGASRSFEPIGSAEEAMMEDLGLSQLRVRPPSVNA